MAKTTILPASAMRSAPRTMSAIQGSAFTQIPGSASQVAASPDGSVWVLSTQPSGPDKYIWHYVSGSWTNISGLAARISVAPNNTLYAVNSGGGTYAYSGGSWTALGGGASALTVAADSSVYVLSNGSSGDQAIWHNVSGVWSQVPGAGVAIAASWDTGTYGSILPGGLYILNSTGAIYYENPSGSSQQFATIPGAASAIAATSVGGIFVLGYPGNPNGNALYYYNLNNPGWTSQAGSGISLSSAANNLYVISASGAIYTSPITKTAPIIASPALNPGLILGLGNYQFSLSESGYASPFTFSGAGPAITVTCSPANCAPALQGANVTVSIAPNSPGNGSLTITDTNGTSIPMTYRVSSQNIFTLASGTNPATGLDNVFQASAGATGSDGNLWFESYGSSPSQPTRQWNFARIATSGSLLNSYTMPANFQTAPMLGIATGPDNAIWFTDGYANIGRISTAPGTLGNFTEYPLSISGVSSPAPVDIALGSDGNLWFTEQSGYIGRITPAGATTHINVGSQPAQITSGPDGALWFTMSGQIDRVSTAGAVTAYPLPMYSGVRLTPRSNMAAGNDGNLWFTADGGGGAFICNLTMGGVFNCTLPLPVALSGSPVTKLVKGPDGAIWATIVAQVANSSDYVLRIDTSSTNVQVYSLPNSGTSPELPRGLMNGPDGALWFGSAAQNAMVRFAP